MYINDSSQVSEEMILEEVILGVKNRNPLIKDGNGPIFVAGESSVNMFIWLVPGSPATGLTPSGLSYV